MRQPIPDGDVLIVAGDLTLRGTYMQIARAGQWLAGLPHKRKLVVAGNHDFLFEKDFGLARQAIGDGHHGIEVLQRSITSVGGLIFFGDPGSAWFSNWAFGVPDSEEGDRYWGGIPETTDVLITHGPAKGILDYAPGCGSVGCPRLLKAVEARKPKLHVFGHIHYSHGVKQVGETLFVNAAICDEGYSHTQQPIVLDYEDGRFAPPVVAGTPGATAEKAA